MGLSSDTGSSRKRSKKAKLAQDSQLSTIDVTNLDPFVETRAMSALATDIANPKPSKKKARKSHKDASLGAVDVVEEHVPEPVIDAPLADNFAEDSFSEPTNEGSRRHKPLSIVNADEILAAHLHGTPDTKASKQKKRAKFDDGQIMDPHSEEAPATKKRKSSPSEECDESTKPRKDKKRKRSKYPDPFEDTELPEHSQKALSYARTFVVDQPSWKFNKATQNWLVRNICSEAMIPGNYHLAVKKYIKTIQGGARTVLVTKCREVIRANGVSEGVDEVKEGAVATPSIVRAQGVLAALGEPLDET